MNGQSGLHVLRAATIVGLVATYDRHRQEKSVSVRLMWVSTEPGEGARRQASCTMYPGVHCSCVLCMYRRRHVRVRVRVCAIEVKPTGYLVTVEVAGRKTEGG